MSTAPRFTIRVYGLLLHQRALLLSRENIKGECYTKFPGGGLEYGEGTLQCLKREFQEEAHIEVEPTQHFYTTEIFVPSAFGKEVQVMSIYYWVSSTQINRLSTVNAFSDSALRQNGDQQLFWQPLTELDPDDVDLPIDKIVVQRLLNQL